MQTLPLEILPDWAPLPGTAPLFEGNSVAAYANSRCADIVELNELIPAYRLRLTIDYEVHGVHLQHDIQIGASASARMPGCRRHNLEL